MKQQLRFTGVYFVDIGVRVCITDLNNMLHDNKGSEGKKSYTIYSSSFITAHGTEFGSIWKWSRDNSMNIRMNRVKNVETSITRIYSSVSLSRPFQS
jgi:hypothetical protein